MVVLTSLWFVYTAFRDTKLTAQNRQLAVIGLGYVGLPVAIAFAKKFPGTIGFDVDARRVESLAQGIDWTHEVDRRLLRESGLKVTALEFSEERVVNAKQ